MKSIFVKSVQQEILTWIEFLNESSKPSWGKMTVAQMVRHCIICERYYKGEVSVKRSALGRVLGGVAIKAILKDENSSFSKNASTSSEFLVSENGLNLEAEKNHWKDLIAGYDNFSQNSFMHWFFGKMTKEQLGQFIYKHSDHHLKQFGV